MNLFPINLKIQVSMKNTNWLYKSVHSIHYKFAHVLKLIEPYNFFLLVPTESSGL